MGSKFMKSDLFSKDWRTERPDTDPKYFKLIALARKEIDLADHLVYVTLPLTDDIKFMLAITEHIFNASNAALEATLEQRRYYKKLEAFPRTYSAMFDIWVRDIQERYNFERKHVDFLKKIRELKHAVATSSMRFRRQDKYILTTDVYDLKVLDIDIVKKYLSVAKDFVDRTEELVKKEEARQHALNDNE